MTQPVANVTPINQDTKEPLEVGLWNKVAETDPAYTKSFKREGGFEGTAINPTYVIRKATEVFGPMGINWGIRVVNEEYIQGVPIFKDGVEICKELIHTLRIELWYKHEGKEGVVTQFGQTKFLTDGKYGPRTDEEAPKKSLTDATTKALSLLGFSADVFLGMYDDNKYLDELKSQHKDGKQAQGGAPKGKMAGTPKKLQQATEQRLKNLEKSIGGIKNSSSADIARNYISELELTQEQKDKYHKMIDDRLAQLPKEAKAPVESSAFI